MNSKRAIDGICITRRATAVVLAIVAFFLFFDRDADNRCFSQEIREAALRHHLEPAFVRAVVFRESRFDPFCTGSRGECGLMQILPETSVRDWAKHHHVPPPEGSELFDIRTNLEIGCWYLARGMKKFAGYRDCKELALICYNAGPSRAEKWKPVSPDGDAVANIRINTTKKYVTDIMTQYRKYRQEEKGNEP